MQRELRVVSLDRRAVSYREDGGDDSPVFAGHAAVFDTPTVIGSQSWGFVERIAAGAFEPALERSDVRMLHNHDPNIVLGRSTTGTLRLGEDKTGLAVEDDFPPTSQARDLAVLLERGDISQMSFAFTVKTDQWTRLDDDDPDFPGMEERVILEFDELFDVSTVTYPAYPTTDAGLRGATEAEVRAVMEAAHRPARGGILLSIANERQRQRARMIKET